MAAMTTKIDDVFSKFNLVDDGSLPSELLPEALKSLDVDKDAFDHFLEHFNDSQSISKDDLMSALEAKNEDDASDDELDDLEGIECTWPCSTVLHGKP